MIGREEELSKDLGLASALAIGVGVMVGAGIFVLPAAAAEASGPASVFAFVVAGLVAVFTALSISELGTAMPRAGGAYYYINDALGPLWGTVAGWGNWLGLAAAVAFYLIGLGSYASTFVSLPALSLEFTVLSGPQLVGLGAGALFVGVNVIGTRETGKLQTALVVVLVLILGVLTAVGLASMDGSNLRPVAPADTGGWGTVLPTAALVFVTYLGFAEINTAAEEIRNPSKNLPLAVLGSLAFAICLYALLITAMIGVVGHRTLAGFGEVAVVEVGEILLGEPGRIALLLAGLLAMASSANASILASSRINFAMGRDRIVPRGLNVLHPRFETPYRSILLTGAIVLALVLVGDIEVLAKAGSVLHLIVYGLLNVALIVFRETGTVGYEPEFKVPLYPLVPLLGALFSFGLIVFVSTAELLLTVAFVALGVVWYLAYARSRARRSGRLPDLLDR